MSSDNGETSKQTNSFVSTWSGKQKLTSEDFLKAFRKYDNDNNGYIEGKEVDHFLTALMSEKDLDKADEKALKAFKDELMKKYDKNDDKRIELVELAKILPTEENFLMQFRLKCSDLTSIDFMKIWKHYDSDCNGYLEKKEIEAFCYDLMSKKKGRRVNAKSLEEFSAGIMQLYDKNKDGKIEIGELQKLMPVEQNYLSRIFEKRKNLTEDEFTLIFNHYDQNQDGSITEDELSALLRDLMIYSGKGDSPTNLERMKNDLMKHLDKNKDKKVQRHELSILFTNKKTMKMWK